MARVLITGMAGMIGYHLACRLSELGHDVRGCDSYTSYYDLRLKQARALDLRKRTGIETDTVDLCAADKFLEYYSAFRPEIVVNLAAQPGVRQGLEQPHHYVNSNLVGFTNVLDACRRLPPRHLLYASSSSVYGANKTFPWSEDQAAELPVSFYAATKKANELMAHSYSHITGVPMTGLRFFTVYGEWGRPDMAPYKFASSVRAGREITVFSQGQMTRDFTYVGDAAEAVALLMSAIPVTGENDDTGVSPVAPHRVVNIGSGRPMPLMEFIRILESCLGRSAVIRFADRAAGDVIDTYASTHRLARLTGYSPSTSFETGLDRLCRWLESYEGVMQPV